MNVRDAVGGRDIVRHALVQHLLRRKRGNQRLGLRGGGFGIKMREQNGELVPADAADDIRLARLTDQHFADCADDGIARRMAMAVVDRLEVVEIEIDEARLDLVALHHGDHARGLAHEGAAIVDRGQRIMVGRRLGFHERELQLFHIKPQRIDLADHHVERGAHLRRQMVFGHAKYAGDAQGKVHRLFDRGDISLAASRCEDGEELHVWRGTPRPIPQQGR